MKKDATFIQVAAASFLAFVLVNLCIFSSNLNASPHHSQLHFERILADDGLTVGFVNSILRDHQGFMWFGGSEGLARYDGYEFHIFHHDPNDPMSLHDNSIRTIALDANNQLWVRSSDGICVYDRNNNRFKRVQTIINSSELEAAPFILDTKNNFWFGADEGLAKLNASTNSFDIVKDDDIFKRIRAMDIDSQGRLWFATWGMLHSWNPITDKTTHYPITNPGDEALYPHIILIEENNGIWLGTSNGLALFDPTTKKLNFFQHSQKNKYSLSNNFISDLKHASKDKIWVGTDGGGLNLLNTKTKKFVVNKHDSINPHTLATDVVKGLYQEPNGDLWVGQFPSGIVYLNSLTQMFNTYRFHPLKRFSLSDNDVGTIAVDNKGNLWLGTGKGLNYFDRQSGKFYHEENNPKTPKTLANKAVMSVYFDHHQRLWAGVWAHGLYRLDPGADQFLLFKPEADNPQSLAGMNVWSAHTDSKGQIWFATDGGVSRYNEATNTFTNYRQNNEDPHTIAGNYTWWVHEDKNNDIWVGTSTGLSRLDPETNEIENFIHTKNKLSLAHNNVVAVTEDPQRNLWFGTSNGVSKFDFKSKNFTNYTVEDGFASSLIQSMVFDNQGMLWTSGSTGITRFNPKTKNTEVFTKNDGLQGNEFTRASVKLKSGELVFGGRNGFDIFQPKKILSNKVAPNVQLTELALANTPVNSYGIDSPLKKIINDTRSITLRADQPIFSLKFSALSYRNTDKNQYQYQLQGFDNTWYHIGNQRQVTYTNLDPGKYTFKVMASNDKGVWSKTSRDLEITVLPPWYETWWAYIIYVLLIGSQLARIYIAQINKRRQAEALSQELELKVQQRTKALQEKTNDINNMLQNMHQGLFTFQHDLKIHPEYSVYLEKILGKTELGGLDVMSTLFGNSNLNGNQLDLIKGVLISGVNETDITWLMNKHLLISEFEAIFPNNEVKILELEWDPLIDEMNYVEKILVTVRDVTHVRKLQAEAEQQKQELNIVGEILGLTPGTFLRFYESAKGYLEKNREILQDVDNRKNATIKLFRNAHTIKGNARTLKLIQLTESMHTMEKQLAIHRDSPDAQWDEEKLMSYQQQCEQDLEHYHLIYAEKLAPHIAQQTNNTNNSFLKRIANALASDDLETSKALIWQQQSCPLKDCFDDIQKSLPDIAHSLNKSTPELCLKINEYRVDNDVVPTLCDVFMHLVRNSMDHGIETDAERREKEKPECATITLTATSIGEFTNLSFSDDGQGLAMSKLREKAGSNKTDAEVAESIFSAGLSTAQKVTDISGRGVGMDAVRAFIQELGGDISIQLEGQEGDEFRTCVFLIQLPQKLVH